MLKTANQRIAALVLVGGVVALFSFLLLAATLPLAHFDLALTWYIANDLAISQLFPDENLTTSPFERYNLTALVMEVALFLSYGLGLSLALRVTMIGWWRNRSLRSHFQPQRFVGVLVLCSGAIFGGFFLEHLDTYALSVEHGWESLQFILTLQLSSAFAEARGPFTDDQILTATVILIALALSYVLSIVLAAQTLLDGDKPKRASLSALIGEKGVGAD